MGDDRGEGGGHQHGAQGRHGNPEDLEGYLARLEGPDRAAWQKPDEVVAALGLRPGDVAGEVGAGPGYFTLRLARAVGPEGRVHAIEVEPRMVEVLRARLAAAGLCNVQPLLAPAGDGLPPEPCRAILVVNTYHHFRDGAAYLHALAGRLAPGGRLVNVDFLPGPLPVGPGPEHKVSREDFLAAAARAGLALVEERELLPYQYFLALAPR